MKKFYSPVLTTALIALTLPALAGENNHTYRLNPDFKIQNNISPKKQDASSCEGVVTMEKKVRNLIGATKSDDRVSYIEGNWEFQLGDYYFENSTLGPITINFVASMEDGTVWFEDPTDEFLPFCAEYNEMTNLLVFSKDMVGISGNFYVFQQPYVYNTTTSKLEYQSLMVPFNVEEGTLVFSASTGYPGMAWSAFNDKEGNDMAGFYAAYDFEGAKKLKPELPDVSIEGPWSFKFGDYYFDDSIQGTLSFNYEATLKDGVVMFEDPTGFMPPFMAEFNSNTNVLTFKRTGLGEDENYYLYQDPFVFNYYTNDLTYQTITATFNPASETIVFPPDNGICWKLYKDKEGNNFYGYYAIFDLQGASRKSDDNGGEDDNDDNWTYVGDATFMDGWVLPALGLDQTDPSNHYKVALQKNINNDMLYRLVDPYHTGPAAQYNQSKTIGHIVFDVTHPDHVLFKKSDAGFANSSIGVSQFFCYNSFGMYVEYYGMTPDEILLAMSGKMPFTTFNDGVIELNYIETEKGVEYDASFGYQGGVSGGYIWRDENGEPLNMCAKIIFPDAMVDYISDVEIEPRYFNLQGIEENNPRHGQIYIKVTGSKAEKILF